MKKILCLLAIAVLIFTLAVPALAVDTGESLGIPSPYSLLSSEGYSYAVIMSDSSGDGYKLYLTDSLSTSSDTQFGTGRWERYAISDGEWVREKSSNFGTVLDYSLLVWCSADLIVDGVVYITHDPNFFPIPLWEKMAQVTQGEMTGLLQNLGGTLKVLVPCGVGCLASLAALKLFGKRSLIYRS